MHSDLMNYNFKQIEKKWQKKWKEMKLYQTNLTSAKNPYYNLMMFPYLSAEGMHVGNTYPYTGSDIWGRYQRMKGNDVFEPIGLDGFGIHSENYAIKIKEHIRDVSKRTEKRFYEQLHMIGCAFDWDHTVETYKENYYKWTQWLFLQMYKNGLAYRKKSPVNWCPSCGTVLSDEQVENGECERCGSEVERRNMEQWFWKITDYAEKLLKNLDWIDWSEDVKVGQRNWIGKKTGIEITYKIKDTKESVTVFTTRPDTNFGATFIVIAPEHRLVDTITTDEYKEQVKTYQKKAGTKTELERTGLQKEKTGQFTGAFAQNPLNGYEMPIFVADYVLTDFGTGIVVGVPGHDKRDFEFAQKYDIEIIRVVAGSDGDTSDITSIEQVNEEEGTMINSEFLNGMDIHKATKEMMDHIEKEGYGKRVTTYRLRDWCISRQRYWGPPIPMIHCEKCGWVPVPEEDLPVRLPEIEKFEDILPDGSGKGPLAKQEDFVQAKCPECGGQAHRETDVSDPFVDSCWYFLRYPSTDFDDVAFDKKTTKKWLPVDMYIGGKEHTVLHLLYARFVTMALKDFGFIDFEEPFKTFVGHGLIVKDGRKMSKSKGNVINPDDHLNEWGADAYRMYMMFMGDFRQGGDWRDTGMRGMFRFVNKVYSLYDDTRTDGKGIDDMSFLHKSIKGITDEIEKINYNTAIAKIMELVNWYNDNAQDFTKDERMDVLRSLLLLMAPFTPHMSEELWSRIGGKFSVHQQSWPEFDNKLIKEKTITIAIQVNGKLRSTVAVPAGSSESDVITLAKKDEKVDGYLKKGTIKKEIYVDGKLVNFVV